MKSMKALIVAITYLCSPVKAYFNQYNKKGCHLTHQMSTLLADFNESTIFLNCDTPCHISISGVKSNTDHYEVFSCILNADLFDDLNGTFNKMIQKGKK